MIVFFSYFYTANVSFKTDEVADNLKKQNGFVPGIRPGKNTGLYLDYVVARILVVSLLIVVSVTMDTIQQVQSHLLAHQYEGLIERSKLTGKNRAKARKRKTKR